MAKKGGVQKLQEDITTDEEFEKFIERPGLLVLDVYSEWCGPCLGMVGSLRKIKMELGGDSLQLAICKADTISYLNRFVKKSEPTWLFVTNGNAVNIIFGTNVPKLMDLITKELEHLSSKTSRPTYKITELQPIEVEKLRIKTEATEKAQTKERLAKEKKRTDYLKNVTDTILENMPDIGVTIFGPQVNRDMFKKLSEPAEQLKMQCKDRKAVAVTIEDFDTVNFACKNPLPTDVIEQLHEKELLMCFWKIDESVGTVPNVLMTYAHELTKEVIAPPDDTHDEEHIVPPLISPLKVKIEVEIKEGEEWEEEESEEEKPIAKKVRSTANYASGEIEVSPVDVGLEDLDEEEDEEEEEGDTTAILPPEISFDFGLNVDMDDLGEEEEVEEVIDEQPKKLTRLKTVKLPAIWVPLDKRTHATLIYVFFRGQTTGFLPPDPKPEPPHVIMAFDAYKRKDLINVIERHKEDIPTYGYFSSDDPEDAQLLANTNDKYTQQARHATDKIVLKVNKVRSNTMLSLVSYGPTYVSPNTDVGHEEALKFFPENYKSAEQEAAEDKPKKKKKSKKESVEGRDSIEEAKPAEVGASQEVGVDDGQQQPREETLPIDEETEPMEGIPAAEPIQPAAEGLPADEAVEGAQPTEGITDISQTTEAAPPTEGISTKETAPTTEAAPTTEMGMAPTTTEAVPTESGPKETPEETKEAAQATEAVVDVPAQHPETSAEAPVETIPAPEELT